MERNRKPRILHLARSSEFVAAGTAAGATVLALLLLAAPAALGATPHALKHTAPYKGSVWVPNFSIYTGGCGSAKVPHKPVWSGATGVATLAWSTQSKSCSSTIGNSHPNSYGSVNTEFDIGIPVHFSKSGNHIITANWTLSVSANQSLTPAGACPLPPGTNYVSCSAATNLNVFGYAYLDDVTNGSQVRTTALWNGINNNTNIQNYTYCYSGTCSYSYSISHGWNGAPLSGNSSFSWVMNASGYSAINSTHTYLLEVFFFSQGYSSENGYVGGLAGAQQDMATSGHGWKLNYLKVA